MNAKEYFFFILFNSVFSKLVSMQFQLFLFKKTPLPQGSESKANLCIHMGEYTPKQVK